VPKETRSQHLAAACALYTFQPSDIQDMLIKLHHMVRTEISFITLGDKKPEVGQMLLGVQELQDQRDGKGASLTRINVYCSGKECTGF